jgi:hypothetical protein
MANEFVARNGLIAQANSEITGSLKVTGGITGSLFGTASFATTSSYILNSVSASYAVSSSLASTADISTQATVTSITADTTRYLTHVAGTGTRGIAVTTTKFVVNAASGSMGINKSTISSGYSLDVSGNVLISGSLLVTGSITGSLFGTASFANTSSYILNAVSASYAVNSTSASYALNSTSASYAVNSTSASFAISASEANFLDGYTAAAFVLNSQTSSMSVLSASFAISASEANFLDGIDATRFAITGSNTFNGDQIITGSLAVGTSSLGPYENTITLGARDTGNEGGQIGFNAPGGTFASASFIDNWSNYIRILRGTNASSTGLVAQWNLGTLQMELPAYTNASSFVGTATANLAVDSSGKVITVSTSGGSVFPYTGNAVITGSLTTTGAIYAQPNGAMYFQGGDDAALYDVNIVNTMGIYGVQDVTVGAVKLGSNGPVLYGSGSKLGIGTTLPTSASLTVNGNIWATSLTGSLNGTADLSTQATIVNNTTDQTRYLTHVVTGGGSRGLAVTTTKFVVNPGTGSMGINKNTITQGYSLDISGSVLITGSLVVTSSGAPTLGQFTGNNNGFVEFSVRNTSNGISASGDIAVYADNGTLTNNYIDMGINNSGLSNAYFYGGTDFGNANDAYLYNVGGDLRIGNATTSSPSQSLYLFSNTAANPDISITGSRVGIQKGSGSLNSALDVFGNTIITGSLTITGSGVSSGGVTIAQGVLSVGNNIQTNSPSFGAIPTLIVGTSGSGVLDLRNNHTAVAGGDTMGVLQFSSKDDGGSGYVSAKIDATTTNAVGTGNSGGGNIRLFTSPGGSGIGTFERMQISSAGFVGINKTSPTATLDVSGSTIFTGSVQGNVFGLPIASNTASLNLNTSNFFSIQLTGSTNTFLNPSNIKPGQTVNIIVSTTGSGNLRFPSTIKQASGSAYTASTVVGTDIITLISFDATNLYLASIKTMI